jgi:hypothetical protein
MSRLLIASTSAWPMPGSAKIDSMITVTPISVALDRTPGG